MKIVSIGGGNMNVNYITEEGFKNLVKELQKIEEEIRVLKEQKLGFTTSSLSEDEDYITIEQEYNSKLLEKKEKEDILPILEIKKELPNNNIVSFGKKVIIENEETEEEYEYQIVGTYETDIEKKKISNICPMGKTLLGKKIGEDFYVKDGDYILKQILPGKKNDN
jgi:transcription elongation factor GreA